MTVIGLDLWNNLRQEPGLYVYRVIGSILIVVTSLIVGRILSARVRRGMEQAGVGPNPSLLMSRSTRAGVWLFGLLWILAIFKVPFTALAAIVSVTALAISLSLQDLLKNLIAGIYMLAERPFHIGDCITVSGVTGVIDDIQMRATYLHNEEGERIVMPNQTVFTEVIVNNTVQGIEGSTLTIEAPRSIAAPEVTRRVLQALAQIPVVTSTPPRLQPVSMSPDTSKWTLMFWLAPGEQPSQVLLALGEALPEATVGVPTP